MIYIFMVTSPKLFTQYECNFTVYKSRIINSQKKLESSNFKLFDFISPSKNEMAEGHSPAAADDSNLQDHSIYVHIYLN